MYFFAFFQIINEIYLKKGGNNNEKRILSDTKDSA